MKPVTDPETLAQLNGTGGDSTGMRQVTDPGMLAKLNERPMLSGHTKGAVVPQPKKTFAPAHTPGAIVAPELQTSPNPAKQREVLGVSRPGTKIFKTAPERKQAVKEVVDTAKALGSVAVSPAVQAVAGLAGITGREGNTSLSGRAETVKKVEETLTYQPQTESGKQAAGLVSYPFEKLAEGAAYLGGKTEQATGSPMAGAAVDTLVNAIPVLLPFLKKGYAAGKAAIQNSEWYRKATVPERGLVVQSLDDIAAGMKAQGFTDAQVDAKLARLDPSYFQAEVQKRMAPERPTHDNLTGDTVIPAAESAKIQATAPEVKPVVKGTPQEILALKQGGSKLPSFKLDDTTAYLLDPNALQGIYGGSKVEAIRQAKKDLKTGGDKESALLGYPNRQGLKPEEMADAGVTKQGAVVTDLGQLKQEAEAGNLAWAAEGKAEEVAGKAEQVAVALDPAAIAEKWIIEQAKEASKTPAGTLDYDHALKTVSEWIRDGKTPKGEIPPQTLDALFRSLKPTLDRETGEWLDISMLDDGGWPRTGTLLDFLDNRELKRFEALDGEAISAPTDSVSLKEQASHSVAPEELGKQVSTPENGIAVMKPTKYLIGLDVDGVLNRLGPDRTESVVDPEFVQRLNAALDKYPSDQTGILLTSSQRAGAVMLDDAAIAQEFLKDAGINHDVVGVTPLVEQGTRGGAEIKPWLNAYAKKLGVEKFVALDDRPDLAELGSQHIKIGSPGVEDGQGIGPEHMARLQEILDNPTSGAGPLPIDYAGIMDALGKKTGIQKGADWSVSDFQEYLKENYPSVAGYPKKEILGALKAAVDGKELRGGRYREILDRFSADHENNARKMQDYIDTHNGIVDTINPDDYSSAIDFFDAIIKRNEQEAASGTLQRAATEDPLLSEQVPGQGAESTPGTRQENLAEAVDESGWRQEVGIQGATKPLEFGSKSPKGKNVGLSEFMDGFTPDPQQDLFRGGSGLADKGGYDLSAKSAIQLPEIVEISKELMEGKLPTVAKKLHAEGVLGSFFPGKGSIKLRADIFSTPGLAERVLAHEVGHLADWLPDKSMAKGNILGRVASLNKYLKKAIEDAPGSGIDVTHAEINAELRALTQVWKPFDDQLNPKFTKYRYSSKELYADAMSVLLNDPALLQQVAPKFSYSFFSYLDRKPEVQRVYEEIQQRLTNPAEVQANRLDQMRGMMDQGNEARQAMNERLRAEGEQVVDTAMRTLVDERWAAKKVIGSVRKLGHDAVADEALRAIEDIPYLASEVSQVLYDFDRKVLKPIEDAKLDRRDLGVYLFAKRIISEEFKDVVMPDGSIQRVDAAKAASKGHTPETARQLLEELKRDLGDEKYRKLQESAQAFREFREKVFLPEFAKSGYFTAEQIQMMMERQDYVRFQVQKFFEEDPIGTGGYAAKIFERVGSLEDTANGFIETMLQDFAFLRAVRVNSSKQAFAKVLKAGGPEFIQPAELKWSKDRQGQVPIEPKNRDLAVYKVKENGKWAYYYVARDLVEAFDQQPVVATQMQRFWSATTQPFREIFVSKNPAWLLRNIPRDFLRTVQNVDDAKLRHIPSLAKAYGQTFMNVWRFTHDGERTPQIQQMMKDKEIPVKRTWENKEAVGEDEITRLLANYGLSGAADKKSLMPVRIGKAFWRFLDNTAATSDVWGKVAADKWLREHSQKTDAQRINTVRNKIATPNFKNRGALNSITNNLFMFSNVGIQGFRSSWQSFNANKGGYLWKAFNLHILPKLILGAAAAGYLGDEYKKILDKVPDYDKRLYHIVPLYIDDKGKARYVRLPDDYEGQWLGAMTWNLLKGDIAASDTGFTSTMSAAAPYSWHPLIQIGGALGDYYLRGQNPVDSFTGQPVLTEDEQKAGGKYAAQAIGRNAFNKAFSSIYRMTPDRVEPDRSDIEKALKIYPLNALGSFYRISDQGDDERIRAALGKVQKNEAAAKIERDKALRDLIRGNTLTSEQIAAIAVHKSDVQGFVQKGLMKKWGMKYVSALVNAKGPKEKMAIIQLMQENEHK